MDSGFFDAYGEVERRALLNSVATMGIAGNALNKHTIVRPYMPYMNI